MNQHSQIYIDFYELHRDSFESIIYFYEHNQGIIQQLPLEEQLELLAEYLNACFETAQYRKYLSHVDELIENLIMYNVQTIHGRNEYNMSLFKKSAALFNLEKYDESIHIVKQLRRMEPANQNARILYRRNLYQNMSKGFRLIRHSSAVGLLASAVLTAVDLFAGPFIASDWLEVITWSRNIIFTSSMIILFVIEMKIRWEVERG
jgi:tetratricopeptide (TPR) repeat protein